MSNQNGDIETEPSAPTTIKALVEKPKETRPLADDPGSVLASMGNYIFTADALVEAVTQDAQDDSSAHDMGGDIVPYFVAQDSAGVYDFIDNDVPGSTDRDRDYWRDVGSLDAFYDAHMDLISVHPVFNLYNEDWPTFTGHRNVPPAKFVHAGPGRVGSAVDSVISPGVVVSGASVSSSEIGRAHV